MFKKQWNGCSAFFPHFKGRWAIITSEGSIFLYVNFVIMLCGVHSKTYYNRYGGAPGSTRAPTAALHSHPTAVLSEGCCSLRLTGWCRIAGLWTAQLQSRFIAAAVPLRRWPLPLKSVVSLVLHQEHAELPVQLQQTLVYEGALLVCRTWTDPGKTVPSWQWQCFSSGLPRAAEHLESSPPWEHTYDGKQPACEVKWHSSDWSCGDCQQSGCV